LSRYLKIGITWARVLTEADYRERGGVIETLEGPASFKVDDYLCHGAANDFWPIGAAKFLGTKVYITGQPEPESGAFEMYMTRGSVEAVQMAEAFETGRGEGEVLRGKAGDYLVRDDDGNEWVVDRTIFENTYVGVEEAN
jgi:hypothetical protein